MNIQIAGIGWIKKNNCGQIIKNFTEKYNKLRSLPSLLVEKSIIPSVIKKFTRFDTASKAVSCAVALGLSDANVSYMTQEMEDIGIIGTNETGCLESNLKYFEDYVNGGRIRGSGKRFIYTLPSSPYAAAAIQFNCHGPLIYTASLNDQVSSLFIQAKQIISSGQAYGMLAILGEQDCAICFVILQNCDQLNQSTLSINKVIEKIDRKTNYTEIIDDLKNGTKI